MKSGTRHIFHFFISLFLLLLLLQAPAAAGSGTGDTAEDPMPVPEEKLVIQNGTYYGIEKGWFSSVNPDHGTMYFSIRLPDSVTAVASDGFRDSYSSDKEKYNAVTYNDNLGRYQIVAIDFSGATALQTINSQAAMGCSALTGVLDLSATRLETLEKSAFKECTGLTGVILPSTLKNIGSTSSGSVFYGCSGLQFVRTAGGAPHAVFELPSGLVILGRQSFYGCTGLPADTTVVLPASVTHVGSEVFYYTPPVTTIVIQSKDTSGYDGSAFKSSANYGYGKRLVVLPNAATYIAYVGRCAPSSLQEAVTYPYTAQFVNAQSGTDVTVASMQNRLYGQDIRLSFDPQTNLICLDSGQTIPPTPDMEWGDGFTGGWVFDNRIILENDSVVAYYTYERDKCRDEISFYLQPIVAPPTVIPIVDGQEAAGWTNGKCDATVLNDGGNHSIGVSVSHPLEVEPENPQEGDIYVDFRFKWTDVAGSFKGPRSGGKNGANPEQEFKGWSWDYNTIPIQGQKHARSGENYYMVEIEGYYTVYSAASGWSNGIRFFKTASTIFGGAGEETNYFPPFRFHVALEGTPEPVTIAPADITVYMGGSGYGGAVGTDGSGITSDSGFPEPGFVLTLPDSLQGVDVTEDLTLQCIDDDKSFIWKFEKYGDGAHQVYRIVPVGGTAATPVRMQFINESGAVVTSDGEDFDVGQYVNQTLTMSVYGREIAAENVRLLCSGTEYPVAVGHGTLTVRGTTSGAVYSPAQTDGESVRLPAGGPALTVPADTVYSINDSAVQVEDTDGVALLFDRIIEGGAGGEQTYTALLKGKVDDKLGTAAGSTRHYVSRYLDLVDTENGNAWVAASGPVTIYWPLPEGTDGNTRFTLLHFTGLHRSMAPEEITEKLTDAAYVPAEVTITDVTDTHVAFQVSTGGFSPFVLVWETPKSDGSDPGTPTSNYTLRYDTDGGTKISSETKTFSWTKKYEDLPVPARQQYIFAGWYLDRALTQPVTGDVRVSRSTVTLYAKWLEDPSAPGHSGIGAWLNTGDHMAYLNGYEDGSFRPDGHMTRGEVAQLFYNLLLEKDVPITVSFSDVPDGAWYAEAVNTLASLGILEGVGGDRFAPDRPITRAEFTALAMRFICGDMAGTNIFSDVHEGDWFYDQVVGSIRYGWITGYEDGTFRPGRPITRAEVTAVVNRMLDRAADTAYVDDHREEIRSFRDLSETHWAYDQIVEAATAHEYVRVDGVEIWKSL